MKTISKIAAAAAAVSVMSLPAINAAAAEGGNFGKLFVMGDSITSGYGLEGYESGNNYSAKDSFANKLAASELFGYDIMESDDYANFAVDGRTSAELLDAVTNDEAFRSRIASADEIVISIGGNDFLQPMMAAAMGAMMNDQDFMNQVLDGTIPVEEAASAMYEKYADVLVDTVKNIPIDESAENISNIFETIYQLNQDCDVYILTVYDPFDYDFGGEDAEGIGQFVDISEEYLGLMNDGIRDAADEYENVYVVDVYSSFDTEAAKYTNIPEGDVHPNKDGHQVIYDLLADSISTHSSPEINEEAADTEDAAAVPAEAVTAGTEPAPAEPEAPPAPASDSASDSAPTGNVSAEALAAITAVSFAAVILSRRREK